MQRILGFDYYTKYDNFKDFLKKIKSNDENIILSFFRIPDFVLINNEIHYLKRIIKQLKNLSDDEIDNINFNLYKVNIANLILKTNVLFHHDPYSTMKSIPSAKVIYFDMKNINIINNKSFDHEIKKLYIKELDGIIVKTLNVANEWTKVNDYKLDKHPFIYDIFKKILVLEVNISKKYGGNGDIIMLQECSPEFLFLIKNKLESEFIIKELCGYSKIGFGQNKYNVILFRKNIFDNIEDPTKLFEYRSDNIQINKGMQINAIYKSKKICIKNVHLHRNMQYSCPDFYNLFDNNPMFYIIGGDFNIFDINKTINNPRDTCLSLNNDGCNIDVESICRKFEYITNHTNFISSDSLINDGIFFYEIKQDITSITVGGLLNKKNYFKNKYIKYSHKNKN